MVTPGFTIDEEKNPEPTAWGPRGGGPVGANPEPDSAG